MTDKNDIPPVEPLPDVPPSPYVAESAPRVDPYAPPAMSAAPVPPPSVPPAYGAVPPTPPGYAPAGYGQPGYGQPGYGQPGHGQPGYGQGAYANPANPYGYPGYQNPAPSGLSVASLVLGIVGVAGSLFYGFGLFPSIAALITGVMARKRQPHARGMWLTGIITGSIGIGISALWVIGIIIFIAFVASASGSGSYSDFGDSSFSGSNS